MSLKSVMVSILLLVTTNGSFTDEFLIWEKESYAIIIMKEPRFQRKFSVVYSNNPKIRRGRYVIVTDIKKWRKFEGTILLGDSYE